MMQTEDAEPWPGKFNHNVDMTIGTVVNNHSCSSNYCLDVPSILSSPPGVLNISIDPADIPPG